MSHLYTNDVKIREAEIKASGVSKVAVEVSDKVDVRAEGISEVKVKGKPAIISSKDLLSKILQDDDKSL